MARLAGEHAAKRHHGIHVAAGCKRLRDHRKLERPRRGLLGLHAPATGAQRRCGTVAQRASDVSVVRARHDRDAQLARVGRRTASLRRWA